MLLINEETFLSIQAYRDATQHLWHLRSAQLNHFRYLIRISRFLFFLTRFYSNGFLLRVGVAWRFYKETFLLTTYLIFYEKFKSLLIAFILANCKHRNVIGFLKGSTSALSAKGYASFIPVKIPARPQLQIEAAQTTMYG